MVRPDDGFGRIELELAPYHRPGFLRIPIQMALHVLFTKWW